MGRMILQLRDVDTDDVAVLRTRAERLGMSLSAYIRNLLHEEATQPTNAEVVERIAAETPIDVSAEEIRGYIESERSW